MKQQKILLLMVLVFVLLLGGAYLLYNTLGKNVDSGQLATQPQPEVTQPTQNDSRKPEETTQATEQEEYKAMDFTVYDEEGNPAKLSDFVGKPIVLNFWASWCGPCKSEMPDFQAVFEELGEEIQFLMVNATGGRESLASAKAFVAESGYTFPVFYDTDQQASMTYGIYALPTTIFIDAQGNMIAHASGAIDEEILMKGIGMITE